MTDESNAQPDVQVGDADEKNAKALRSARRPKKPAADGPQSAASKVLTRRGRKYSHEERARKLSEIRDLVTAGSKLKDALSQVDITEQTYYNWKSAEKKVAPAPQNEMTDLVQLEEENRRLRKLLAVRLRAENAELRRRLGIG
jgi:putative transposase